MEAVAFERYNITCALFLYGMLTVYLLLIPADSLPFSRMMPIVLACLLAAPMALPSYRGGVRRLLSETYHVPIRQQIDSLQQKHPLVSPQSAALYIGDQYVQQGFVSYILAYTFQEKIPIYTAETLHHAELPEVLYALQTDDTLRELAENEAVEIVTP